MEFRNFPLNKFLRFRVFSVPEFLSSRFLPLMSFCLKKLVEDFADLAGTRLDAHAFGSFSLKGGHRDTGKTAWGDVGEGSQITANIDGKPMHGDPAADTDS
jgi:hypothetical protein